MLDESDYYQNYSLSEAEIGAKIVDDLLVLFDLYKEDYSVVNDALKFIAERRQKNSNFPITVRLSEYMKQLEIID